MMKKLKIGIDIDNVIADTYTSYLERFNREFGLNIRYEELVDFYYLEKQSGIKLERVNLFLDTVLHDDKLQLSHKPYTQAIAVIKKWIKQGFSIHYITARPTFTKKTTMKWLQKHGFWGKGTTLDLYDSEEERYKTDIEYKKSVTEKLSLDIFIEDYAEIAKNLSIPVLLLDRPWNRIDKLPPNVKRVKDWQEIDLFVSAKFNLRESNH